MLPQKRAHGARACGAHHHDLRLHAAVLLQALPRSFVRSSGRSRLGHRNLRLRRRGRGESQKARSCQGKSAREWICHVFVMSPKRSFARWAELRSFTPQNPLHRCDQQRKSWTSSSRRTMLKRLNVGVPKTCPHRTHPIRPKIRELATQFGGFRNRGTRVCWLLSGKRCHTRYPPHLRPRAARHSAPGAPCARCLEFSTHMRHPLRTRTGGAVSG